MAQARKTRLARSAAAPYMPTMDVPDQLRTGTAVLRGLQRHCPYCDARTLFAGYLKVAPRCRACGADNGQHRVDDIATYVTVLLVGHLVIAPVLAIPYFWGLPLWVSMSIILTGVAAATLAALPFIKGGVVGLLAATSGTRAAKRAARGEEPGQP